MKESLLRRRHLLQLYAERLKGLSPLDKLSQGFSSVTDVDNKVIADVDRVERGQLLVIHMKNGVVKARAEQVERVIR